MPVTGPSRLVLLRAGKYDYGEVELVAPLHLVGPNNVGKTSLIAVLQFLYIDDQRHMHFARDLHATRKYYFPDQNSYILFECLTPAGYQVVGVRGLGPVRSYNFARFAYQGRYQAKDFLDEQQRIRPWEAIQERLASREFRHLEPKHLRAALTGLGDNQGVNLGLVPIRHRDQYQRFRAVFCNLLRLAHLRQEELKGFLLEIHQGQFQQQAIDLEESYSAHYRKVRQEVQALRELKAIAPQVEELLTTARQRDELRQQLPGLWQALENSFRQAQEDRQQQQQQLEEQLKELSQQQSHSQEQQHQLQQQRDELLQQLGQVQAQIRQHDQQTQEFADFVPSFEEENLRRLQQETGQLQARLAQAAASAPEPLRRRVQRLEQELHQLQRQRQQLADNAAAAVLPWLEPEEQDGLFRLLNPQLLGLPQGTDGANIYDAKGLRQVLTQLAQGLDGSYYRNQLLQVNLEGLSAPELAMYQDPETLDQRLSEQQAALEREQQLLTAAEDAAQLRQQHEQLEARQRQSWQKLERYRQFCQGQEQIQQQRHQAQQLQQQQQQLDQQLTDLAQHQRQLEHQQQQLKQQQQRLHKQHQEQLQRFQQLTPPQPDWPLTPFATEGYDLGDLLELYAQRHQQHQQLQERCQHQYQSIDSQTYSRYQQEDEAATLKALQDAVDGLEEREKAAQELWKSLAAGLQSAFKGLQQDLETLTSRIDSLNRQLGHISISNLQRLRLHLREHPKWTRRIKTLVEADDMPLFTDQEAVNAAHQQLGELLQQYRRVELGDLFDLHFEVTTADNQTRRYSHLDSIESNGTTITIKVLINLLLLKGLLQEQEVSLPFYLDEASSLDWDNLQAIVAEARRMGFIAVLASPDPMEAADRLYFLREHNGRVSLNPDTDLIRLERPDDGQSG